jgi:hypothetical protein
MCSQTDGSYIIGQPSSAASDTVALAHSDRPRFNKNKNESLIRSWARATTSRLWHPYDPHLPKEAHLQFSAPLRAYHRLYQPDAPVPELIYAPASTN